MLKKVCLAVILVLLTGASQVVWAQDDPLAFTRPTQGDYDATQLASINIEDYPILPVVTDTATLIFAKGQELGNVPNRFSKIGDCMTASPEFLNPFGASDYDLGDYKDLQTVVDFFSVPARDEAFKENSFANPGLGTQSGFNTSTLTDPLFADPTWCSPNESSLQCEYRVSHASFALIMLGTNDVMFFEPADFDFAVRNIVLDTIDAGIVPILYTFPIRPDFPENTDAFNKIIIQISQDYDLPLVNFWLAINDLPNHGVKIEDPIHLSEPKDGKTGVFSAEGLQFGYNMRNLVTLQALGIMIKGLTEEQQ